MFQFYKKRSFSNLISDTITFFKIYGKNYFKNYFMLNGVLLIAMVAVTIFGYRELFSLIFGGNMANENYLLEEYFADNWVLLVIITLVVMALYLLLLFFNYLFPVLYLKRLAELGHHSITTDQILSDIKKNALRFLQFILGMIFIITPLVFIVFGTTILLMFLIIGIFLMIIAFPIVINICNFTLFDYFNAERGFFGSLSYAIRSQFSYSQPTEGSPFWKYIGSSLTVMIIIQTVVGIVTSIPMIITTTSSFTVPTTDGYVNSNNPFESMGIAYFVIQGVSVLLSLIASNIIYVNNGLMYYDSRLDLHRKEAFDEIDSIGNA
ncbi:MAG: DUF4013 domain-containing protein [Capnocytophaga sp.]|nr:DUF4013 domain-containing protein [Capnocytophaga sp.]